MLKLSLDASAQNLIEATFNPVVAVRTEEAKQHDFNYPLGVYTKWRGRYFYFCAKYRERREGDFFEVQTTRLEYAGGGRFHLAYKRHTDQWCEVFSGLTVEACLDTIESMELFWPVH